MWYNYIILPIEEVNRMEEIFDDEYYDKLAEEYEMEQDWYEMCR